MRAARITCCPQAEEPGHAAAFPLGILYAAPACNTSQLWACAVLGQSWPPLLTPKDSSHIVAPWRYASDRLRERKPEDTKPERFRGSEASLSLVGQAHSRLRSARGRPRGQVAARFQREHRRLLACRAARSTNGYGRAVGDVPRV